MASKIDDEISQDVGNLKVKFAEWSGVEDGTGVVESIYTNIRCSYLLEDDEIYDTNSCDQTPTETDSFRKDQNRISRLASLTKRRVSAFGKEKKMRDGMKQLYARRSVLANFEVPVIQKRKEEKDFIRKNIALNFLFSHANEQYLSKITDAFEKSEFSKDDVIIRENKNGDYFYLIETGLVQFTIKGCEVGIGTRTECFGELSLLYSCPRVATCVASTDCKLWRIDRKTFNYILSNTEATDTAKSIAFLRRIPFLSNFSDMFLEDLARSMKTQCFTKDESIIKKGKSQGTLYILKSGEVRVHDIYSDDNKQIDDKHLRRGDYFGELSIVKKEKAVGNVTAVTDCEVLTISGDYFHLMGTEVNFYELVIEANYSRMLIDLLSILKPRPHQIKLLSSSIFHVNLDKGVLFHEEEFLPKKGLFFVLSGSVKCNINGESYEKKVGDCFGMITIFDDVSSINAEVIDACRLGVLTYEVIKENTCLAQYTKERNAKSKYELVNSLTEARASLITSDYSRLRIHSELGKGAFGKVWLTTLLDDAEKRTFALKEVKKKHLIKMDCVRMILREARILTMINHKYIIDLVNVYQNGTSLFMLFPVISGGELFELMEEYTCFSERASKFYSAVVLESLSYLHEKNILYRDLKPENVLLDKDGYCILVDFGFAKQTREKTFTLCGTPLYLAPEIILNQGQDVRVDYWAWAVMLYEMVFGENPFDGGDDSQVKLFKKICKGNAYFPDDQEASDELYDLLSKSLKVDQNSRIGSVNGCEEIREHKWFDKFDFESMREKKMKAPWKPEAEEGKPTLGNGKELKVNPEEITISEEEQRQFDEFGIL